VEEYLVSKKLFELTNIDLSEIARNSVLISNFDHDIKVSWLGDQYWKPSILDANDANKSNVPAMRCDYRQNSLIQELKYIVQLSQNVIRRANIALDKREQSKSDENGLTVFVIAGQTFSV